MRELNIMRDDFSAYIEEFKNQKEIEINKIEINKLEMEILSNKTNEIQKQKDKLNYAPLTSLNDPVSTALKYTPFGGNLGVRDRNIRVRGEAGTEVSRTWSPSLSGSGFGGLPATLGGSSSVSTSSGGSLSFDLSGPLNLAPNQGFGILAGAWANTTLVSTATGAGSGDSVNFALAGLYSFGANYLVATALYDTGTESLRLAGLGKVGRFGTRGFAGDFEAGHYFGLWSSRVAGIDLLADGWKVAGVDLSGHVGVAAQRSNSFVDVFGTLNGAAGADRTTIGPAARLSALYKADRLLFLPYVKFEFDYAPESKLWARAVPAGSASDARFSFDRTSATIEGGLDVTGIASGLKASASAYFVGGSSTRTVGGRLSLSIPLL